MPQTFQKESITVAYMADRLRDRVGIAIEQVNQVDATARLVSESDLHRPGLALAGYTELFTFQRVQVLGNTETRFLNSLGDAKRSEALERLLSFNIPCLILTAGNQLADQLVGLFTQRGVPLFRTAVPSTEFMYYLRDFLEDQFAVQQTLHGSLVDVYGIGLLLTGKSGIGKSEVALDLVERGHRLVADDVVVASRKGESVIMGSGTELAQHFMEIRGLGIIDVRAMFGIRAIRFQKRIEVLVRMERWDENEEYTRLGMVDESESILGIGLPLVKLPIVPGKNVTVICEVIAMNYLLRHYGYDPAEVLTKRLSERINSAGGPSRPLRGIEYFERDIE
ncbi:HPr(Ser) kinase/phosphatase [soil metagenome]